MVEPSPPVFSGEMAYRGVIPAKKVGWPSGTSKGWVGDGKHFLSYPVRGGELIAYFAYLPTDEEMKESWSAPGDPAALAREYADFDPVLRDLLSKIETTYRWGIYDRAPLPQWTRGRLTLLGDAAHPMVPHAGQGANQAIEDGVALAVMLAGATRETVPQALLAYEALRRERTAQVQQMARRRGVVKLTAAETASNGELAKVIADPKTWIREYDVEAAAIASRSSAAWSRFN